MVATFALTSHEYLDVSTDYETQPRASSIFALSSTQSPPTVIVEDSFNMGDSSRKQQEIENRDPYKFDGSPRSDSAHDRQNAPTNKRKRDGKASESTAKKQKTVGKLTSAKHAQTSVPQPASKVIQSVARTIPPQSTRTNKRPQTFNSIGPNSISYESREKVLPQQKQKEKDAPIVNDRMPKAAAVIKFGPNGVQKKVQTEHGGVALGDGNSSPQDKIEPRAQPRPTPGLDITNVAQSEEDILAGFERPAATVAPVLKSPGTIKSKEHNRSTSSTESRVSTIVDATVVHDAATLSVTEPQQIKLPQPPMHGDKSNQPKVPPSMSDGKKPKSKSVKPQKARKKPARHKGALENNGEQKKDDQGAPSIEKHASELPIDDSGYYSTNRPLMDKARKPEPTIMVAKRDNALQPARRISEKGSPLLGDATFGDDAELASLVDEESLSDGHTPSRIIFEPRGLRPTVELYAEPINQQKYAPKQSTLSMTVQDTVDGHAKDADDLDIDVMLDWRESLASHQRFMFDTFVKDARGLVDVLVAREVEVQNLIEQYRSRGRAIHNAVQVHGRESEHYKHSDDESS